MQSHWSSIWKPLFKTHDLTDRLKCEVYSIDFDIELGGSYAIAQYGCIWRQDQMLIWKFKIVFIR